MTREDILKEIEEIKEHFKNGVCCAVDEEKSERAAYLHKTLREMDQTQS